MWDCVCNFQGNRNDMKKEAFRTVLSNMVVTNHRSLAELKFIRVKRIQFPVALAIL